MPDVMKRLALVQFFSWSALFIMWIFTTPVVAQYMYGSRDPASAAYNAGGDWVGVLFAAYDAITAMAALLILPKLAVRIGQVRTHLSARRHLGVRQLPRRARSTVAARQRDRHRHRLGVDPCAALCDPRLRPAQAKLCIYMGLSTCSSSSPTARRDVMGSVLKAFFPTDPYGRWRSQRSSWHSPRLRCCSRAKTIRGQRRSEIEKPQFGFYAEAMT
jgi:maltose/moltooligosaccharide transporter